jgi:SH3 domain-containing YSC84-like protein 1
MRKLTSFLVACLAIAPALADAKQQTTELQDAQQVLRDLNNAPDKGIPRDLLERAECIGVFPGVTKAALVIGGEFGHGVFTCRQPGGAMGPPAFFTIGGPSVGWQVGAEQVDLVLLIMDKDGLEHLLKDNFTIGGDASAAAGPVGRTATAATDAQMHAELLSWSRTRGIFAGVALAGKMLKPDQGATDAFYGQSLTVRQILVEGKTPAQKAARAFMDTINEYARRAS